MKKQETSSFQENIRNMFIVYSIVPVFVVTCLALLLVVSVWSYTTIQMDQVDNRRISSQLQNMVQTYQTSLDAMETITTENELYEMLYQLKNTCHYQSNFYVLNENQDLKFVFGTETPGFLIKKEYVNWGIMKQLKENTGNTCITVQNGILCIGKRYECSEETFDCIFTIPAQGLQEALTIGSRRLIITDAMGWIFYCNQTGLQDNMSRLDREVRCQSGFIRYQGRQYYIMRNSLNETGMCVITITDTENSFHVILLILGIIILIFLAIGLITFFSTKKMKNDSMQKFNFSQSQITEIELILVKSLELFYELQSPCKIKDYVQDYIVKFCYERKLPIKETIGKVNELTEKLKELIKPYLDKRQLTV